MPILNSSKTLIIAGTSSLNRRMPRRFMSVLYQYAGLDGPLAGYTTLTHPRHGAYRATKVFELASGRASTRLEIHPRERGSALDSNYRGSP
jgi:hypothetical protein